MPEPGELAVYRGRLYLGSPFGFVVLDILHPDLEDVGTPKKDTQGLVILSTHTGSRVDYELATRVLTQEITHDEALAREVYRQKAGRQNGSHDETAFRVWQAADSLIEARDVQIPYLPQLAELFPTNQERYHRDYDKVIALVRASVLLHQYQRKHTEDGAVIADRQDYELVYTLSDAFTESVLPVSQPVLSFLKMLRDNPDMTRAEAQKALSISEGNQATGQLDNQKVMEKYPMMTPTP
jgi:hypothetical protein